FSLLLLSSFGLSSRSSFQYLFKIKELQLSSNGLQQTLCVLHEYLILIHINV
ncbi:hypothetical protein GIB67_043036, partial [Kingdonia uniflora]